MANVTFPVSDVTRQPILDPENSVRLSYYKGDRDMKIDAHRDDELKVQVKAAKKDASGKVIEPAVYRPMTVGEFMALAFDAGAKRGRKAGA